MSVKNIIELVGEVVKNLIDLVGVVAWPVVVVTAILLLRRPLSSFLDGMGRRATRLSIFQVELELSEVPEFRTTWSAPHLSDVRQPTSAAEFDSGAMALFEEFEDDTAYDYAIVDLEAGKQWLTSRLFIFAVMLERMRGLRCFVFLATSGGVQRRFVGMAQPSMIRWSLAMRYPWLESALAKAYSKLPAHEIRSVHGALEPLAATMVVRDFLSDIQQAEDPVAEAPTEWVTLEDSQGSQTWEHASWLDEARLRSALGNNLQLPWEPHSQVPWVVHSPQAAADEQAKMVLRREGPYVAVVEDDKVFKSLIDRHTLVEQVAKEAAESPYQQAQGAPT